MTQAEKEKNYIDTLLNAISTNEAVEVFNLIDHKIIKLLECASEDFMLLNTEFKNYFKDYKHINTTAKTLSVTFIELLNEETIGKIDAVFENIEDQTLTYVKTIEENHDSHSWLIKKHNENFLALNNIKQHFSTIKLFLANLNIVDNQLADNQVNKKNAANIDNSINEIKTIIGILENLNERIKQQLVKIDSKQTDKKNISFRQTIEKAQKSFLLLQEMSVKAPAATEIIKEFSNSCSVRIEKIVTNLQYSDIIRQKIEHIQKSHKDILSELNCLIANEGNVSQIHNKVKVFFKIRDVAGLQAAQLLHANLQYQNSISEINSGLDLIGNEMVSISKQSNSLFSNDSEYFPIDEFSRALNSLSLLINIDGNSEQTAISELNTGISEFNAKVPEAIKTINDLALFTINYVESQKKCEISQTDRNNLDHISSLIKEIDLTVVQLHFIEEQQLKVPKDVSLSLSENINEVQSFINKLISETRPLYIEEKNLSTGVAPEILNSIKRVKYYELFEEVCDDIIDKLNQLNLKLNYGREVESPITREQNLEKLKSRYTMESEHLIHDHMSKNIVDVTQSEETLLGLIEQKTEEDDDNLELF